LRNPRRPSHGTDLSLRAVAFDAASPGEREVGDGRTVAGGMPSPRNRILSAGGRSNTARRAKPTKKGKRDEEEM
jgi:hypothetical protein